MKTKLTLLLLFFCLLPMAAQEAEDNQHWTDFVSDTKISDTSGDDVDIVYELKNEIPTYTIYTAKGLAWVAKVTNAGLVKKEEESEAKYYPEEKGFKGCTVQLGEIAKGQLDISGHKWEPIGNSYAYFYGTFDGKNQEITGLRIEEDNIESIKFYGLFGYIDEAIIENLGILIKTITVDGESNGNTQYVSVGGIVGEANGSKISNCYVYGEKDVTIQVDNTYSCCIGGLIGKQNDPSSFLTNCYSMINITASSNKIDNIGGIAGVKNGTLTNTFATGSIEVNSPIQESYIGGICGKSYEATLNNNLALNKGGIKVTNDNKATVHVARIGGFANSEFKNNYATPNFTINGEKVLDEPDADGTTIGAETDLAAILNEGNTGDKIWSFSEEHGLPYINAFGEDNQPIAKEEKKDYEVGGLELDKEITEEYAIYLQYKKGSGWWQTKEDGTQIKPFNGEISGKGITKGVSITGGTGGKDTPTLTVVKDLGINNSNGDGMSIYESVNLSVAKGKKLDISGQNGLYIEGNLTLYQSQNKSRATGDGGITITGTKVDGIQNGGTLNINVNNLTIEGKGDNKCGIRNTGIINCKTGSIEINGNNGIDNYLKGAFNIKGAEVTINQGDESAILNQGSFSIASTGTLNILTKEGSQPKIDNEEGSTYTLESGATFRTGKIGAVLPDPYILTYSDPSEGTLSITDQSGIGLPSTSNIGAGTELKATVSGNTKEIENVTYTLPDGSLDNATLSDVDNTYTFEMPAAPTTVSVVFKADPEPEPDPKPEPDPNPGPTPIVYQTVTLPEVEGIILDPGAGDYDVEKYSTFRFFLTLLPEYDQSQPIVTTDRYETIVPRASDGAYLIKFVQRDVAITIDGIVKNPDPVANDAVDADNITIRRTADGLLIHVPSPETLTLYTFAGTLVRTIHLPAGDTRIDVPTGTYIVRVGTKVEKVII